MAWQLRTRRRVWSNDVMIAKKRNDLFPFIKYHGGRVIARFVRSGFRVLLSYPLALVAPDKAICLRYESKRKMAEFLGLMDGLFDKSPEPYRTVTGS